MSERQDELAVARTGERRSEAPDASAPRAHVLIVDDHAMSRVVCAEYCDLFDHTSETARSGDEAVAALRRGRFDVVVMNVHMQDARGVAAVRAIRDLPSPAAQTPIIGLAAPGRADEAQRWLAAGVAGLIERPVTAARLFAAIRSVVGPAPLGPRSWAPA
ncbi:MAG TPA: response regulator [Caulobacteraceae bacterium]|nr:response regulator [Caulobacteraceae bacterium]